MNKSLALKNKIFLFFLLLTFLFIFIYSIYFLINGERGIIAFYKITNQNSNYERILSNLEKKDMILSDKILRLQTNTLDLDFLEEKIREKTGYLQDNEISINFNY
jgi:cell division protein FtsB